MRIRVAFARAAHARPKWAAYYEISPESCLSANDPFADIALSPHNAQMSFVERTFSSSSGNVLVRFAAPYLAAGGEYRCRWTIH
jgi:hypothetical protein